jgi:transitional endoplasmic reticulum ATPase
VEQQPQDREGLRDELLRSLHRLPPVPAPAGPQAYGPAAPQVERFLSDLRGLPSEAWAQASEYRHNLEENPVIRKELLARRSDLLELAFQERRGPALKAAGLAALESLPDGARPGWEVATLLAVWAVALGDLLSNEEFELFYLPFRALKLRESEAPPFFPPGTPPAPIVPQIRPRPGSAPAGPPTLAPGSWTSESHEQEKPLPTFADVGGLDEVKSSIKKALSDALTNPEDALKLRVRTGGILLYGPPGNGKWFLARATAGELHLDFLTVSGADLQADRPGEGERRLRLLFQEAGGRRPCVVFLDQLESIAPREGEAVNEAARRSLRAALVGCLNRAAETPSLVVMAATDSLEQVDSTVISEGVFDFKIQVHDPDPEARRMIFEKHLHGRSLVSDPDLTELVENTGGRSAAYLANLVNRAAQHALHRITEAGGEPLITLADLRAALGERVEMVGVRLERKLTWDDLVLPEELRRRLIVLQKLVEDPARARALGIGRIPRGAVLFGPPRTGKTSIAKVLAAQTSSSFFAISATELRSKWVGETERKIRDLFRQAREARPALVFVDEIDAIAARRGAAEDGAALGHNSALNQMLVELDGFQTTEGVLVIGATNRYDLLDPAITAGGRLSEHLEVPAPDREGRLRLFQLYTKRMPLEPSVDLERLADLAQGLAGGDIESICSAAGMNAFGREASSVCLDDFETALDAALAGREDIR